GTQTNTATKYLFSARGGPIRAAYKCTQAFVQGMAMKNPKTKRFDWSQVLRDEARITDVLLTEELATKLNLSTGSVSKALSRLEEARSNQSSGRRSVYEQIGPRSFGDGLYQRSQGGFLCVS